MKDQRKRLRILWMNRGLRGKMYCRLPMDINASQSHFHFHFLLYIHIHIHFPSTFV